MSRFSVEEHLRAVEIAITMFRFARNDPTSAAGQNYLALKDLAAALRAQMPDPDKVVVRS